MVSKLRSLLRNNAFRVWIAGGIGGILPDVDHIPTLLGIQYRVPVFGELNVLLHITNDVYGRQLHSAFFIIAIICLWHSISHLRRCNESRVLK